MTLSNIEKIIKAIKNNEPILIKNFVDDIYKGEIKFLLKKLEKNNNIQPLLKDIIKNQEDEIVFMKSN